MADPTGSEPNATIFSRQETILARYSRNFKLSIVTGLLAITILPWSVQRLIPPSWMEAKKAEQSQDNGVDHQVPVRGADKDLTGRDTKLAASINKGTVPKDIVVVNNQDDANIKLTPAPDVNVTEDTALGSLPRISEDGRPPWQVYARPYNIADTRPRIAIVINNLGLSRLATDAAISRMPTNVTLAFDVQSPVIGAWIGRARMGGHECIIDIPMEPFDYPRSDPGPNTLLTSLPSSDNLQRLQWALRQAPGYVGLTTFSGSRFVTDPERMRPVFDTAKHRGLLLFDSRVAPHSVISDMAKDQHIPVATATLQLDDSMSASAIDSALDRLEKEARLNGRAVGVAASTPIVLDRLQNWLKGLPDRGISLAPLTALVQ
jgi:hypothetical protein